MDLTAADQSSADAGRTSMNTVPRRTLDDDLLDRLAQVTREEAAGAERFGSSRPVLVESLGWIGLGALIWVIALMVWL